MILNKLLATSLTIATFIFTLNAEAATFKTPKNYSILIVDGQKVGGTFSQTTSYELSKGQHQVVVFFKGAFKNGKDQLIHSATDPIVINMPHVQDSDKITFTFPRVVTYDQAQNYSDKQKIDITINEEPAKKEDASYFILKSDKGFQLDRDFLADLQSLNLLYVSEENNQKIIAKDDTLTKCRDSGFTNCPDSVKAPVSTAVVAKKPQAQANTVTAPSQANTKINTQMLDGMKAIYNSADKDTQTAFKEWLNTL